MGRLIRNYPVLLGLLFTFFCGTVYGQLQLTSENGFIACGTGNTYEITVKQGSVGVYKSYKLEWGDGGVNTETKFTTLKHTYTASGTYTIKFSGEIVSGWSAPVEYTVTAENKSIVIQAEGSSIGAVCRGQEMTLKLTNLGNNSASTKYTVGYGDGTNPEDYAGKMDNLTLKHIYTKSSCEAGSDGFYVKISATNGCNNRYETEFGPYPIAEQVRLSLNLPEKACTGYEADLEERTQTSPESCGVLPIEKMWTRNGVPVDNSYQVFDDPGTYTFIATATMAGLDCSNQSAQKTIKIIRKVKAIASPVQSEICEGDDIRFKGSDSEGDEKAYRWSVRRGNAAHVTFAPDNRTADPMVTFKKHGTYQLQLEVSNDCSVDYAYVDIIVKKNPEIVEFKPLPALCPGKTLKLAGYISYDWTWEGNPNTPLWSVTGPEGGAEILFGAVNAEYPQVTFTKPGDYTLQVELTGVGCGDPDKLKASRAITIYDDRITGEITPTNLNICENEHVVFTNNMQGVNLRTVWEVTTASGGSAQGCFLMTSSDAEKTLNFQFTQYGEYKVKAFLTAECGEDTREFTVKVRRAPEVYFREFPRIVCPENPFQPGEYVDLRFFGNEGLVAYTWEVTGGSGNALLEGANSANPKITFPTHGLYTIKLTINNPTSCTSPSLSVSKDLDVSNPQMDLNINPTKTTICVREQVTFVNTSSVAVEPDYRWSVSPEGYRFVNADGAVSKEPTIEFTKSGIYSVTAIVNGVCRPETKVYTIVVQQDPEVQLDEIPAICPGNLTLGADWVHYTWNDNWKSGAESTRRVVWKLLSKPDGAICTPPESLEWNALHPALSFNTPGNYVLQVEVKSDASCGGTQKVASRTVTVYDPVLSIDVKPLYNADVINLGGGKGIQVVEGSPVNFVNRSAGVGLRCLWSVDEPAHAVISDATANEPSITFTKFGTYKVRVDLIGTCSRDYREFTVIVKGIPKFDFKPIANRCDDWEEIDLRDYVSCDSAGSTEIICNWNIVPAVGYTLSAGTTSDMFFKIKFNNAGNYTLTLKAQAEYGGVQTVSRVIRVLRSRVQARADLSQQEGCTTDGLQVIALNVSDGDSLSYEWKVTPPDGCDITAVPEKLTMNVHQAGDYRILLKAKNICAEDQAEYPVRAYSKPEVEILGDPNLGTVCEKGYLFKGTEHVGEIRVNNDPLTFVRWTVSPEGTVWQNGSRPTDTRPDLSFAGDKSYRIIGEFKNHCKDTVKVRYTLSVDKYVPVVLMPDTVVCARTDAFLLRAAPHGGEWSSTDGNTLEERAEKNYYFNPYKDEYAVYEMTYQRGNGQCLATGTMNVTVNRLPLVDAGIDRHACLNDGPMGLTGITPVDGEWRGTGVRDNTFYPGENGADIFRLEYWYTDANTGCPNLDTINMTVYGLPDPAFKASAQQCRVTDSLYIPVELGQGHRFLWDFGNGDTRVTEDAPVSYQYPDVGDYPVFATVTSKNNCTVVGVPQTVKVLDLPLAADFSIADTAGCGPFTTQAEVDPDHFAGPYLNLSYLWNYGNGNSGTDLLPTEQTYQAGVFDTTYQVVLKVYNVCGQTIDSIAVGVWSKAVARFAMNPEEEGCTPAEVFFMNKSTGSYNTYSWDFGDGQASAEIDPVHIYTTNTSMSVFNIRLKAENRCTPEGTWASRSLKVKPNTIMAGFTKNKRYLCAGDTVCFENNSVDRDPTAALNYSWDFGDGQVAAVWDTCHRYDVAGTYHIKLKVDNGCAHREFNDSVFVHVLPVLTLEGDGPLCEDIELALKLSSDEPLKNVVWDLGDGTAKQNGVFQIKHAFEEPGQYVVKVKGEANQIPSCPGEVTKTVQVWSNPRVKIEPLDTMACPPLLYRPLITATSYDYFTWDYGDGTPLTSEMEHLYENDTNVILKYPVTAYVENNYGCKEQHQGLIRIYNGPKVAWDKEVSYGRPEKVRFINLSRDYTQTIWYLPFGQEVHSPEDQTVIFNDEGVYPMALAVVNSYGCRDSISQEYRSYEGGLYFPNSFIPHSTNPKVSHFNGIGMGLKEYKLEIFDMYGNKVWETTALEGGVPSEGWDGRNQKGELLPQGVYMWRAEAVFFSEDVWTGGNNRSGKPQTTQGTVLLLRK